MTSSLDTSPNSTPREIERMLMYVRISYFGILHLPYIISVWRIVFFFSITRKYAERIVVKKIVRGSDRHVRPGVRCGHAILAQPGAGGPVAPVLRAYFDDDGFYYATKILRVLLQSALSI